MNTRYAASLVLACSVLALNAQTLLSPDEYDVLKGHHLLPGDPVIIGDPGTGLPLVPSGNARSGGGPCDCWIEPDSSYSLAMQENDDGSSTAIPLPFGFQLFGQTYDSLYINNNGNVSFGSPYFTFTAYSFPDPNFLMVAPFWGDVDTRDSTADPADFLNGQVDYKLTPHALYVNWVNVGYYAMHGDMRNSFQLILTDGTDPIVPTGNVSYCYHDMQWTTGDASSGIGGFGGVPATVGANLGDSVNYAQIGRYDHAGIDYDGPFGLPDGISWLDSTHFYFDASGSLGVPPIFGSEFNCDTVIVLMSDHEQRDLTATYHLLVLPAGPGQLVSCASDAPGLPSFTPINAGPAPYLDLQFTIDATGAAPGTHLITFTATNDAAVPLSSQYQLEVFVSATAGLADVGSSTEQGLLLRPTLADDHITAQWPSSFDPKIIELLSTDGRLVKSWVPEARAEQAVLNVHELDAGQYLLRISGANGVLTSRFTRATE